MIVAVTLVLALLGAPPSLDAQHDEDTFLRGLVELELPEVLEHYIATSPSPDPVVAAQYGVAAQAIRVRQAAGDPKRRLEALEQLLALRQKMIDDHAAHPRRAVWLADQAEDLFFQLLPSEGAELMCFFGQPDVEQEQIADRVATEMREATTRAERDVQRAIIAIESAEDFRTNESLQIARRRLARDERDRRIPFLRGVAAYLEARRLRSGGARAEPLRLAAQALDEVLGDLDGALAARGHLYRGLVALDEDDLELAQSRFADVLKNKQASGADRLAAELGQADLVARSKGPARAVAHLEGVAKRESAAEGLFAQLLFADRAAAWWTKAGDATAAAAGYMAILDAPDPAGRPTRRAVVYPRLARLGISHRREALPEIVVVAMASEEVDPERALAMYEDVLERTGAEEEVRVAARLGRVHALERAGRVREAIAEALELGREHAAHPDTASVVDRAARLARARRPREEALYREAVTLITEAFPDLADIDRWRYAAGRLAMQDGNDAAALAALADIRPGSSLELDALFMTAIVHHSRATKSEPSDRPRRLETALASVQSAGKAVDAALRADGLHGDRLDDVRYYDTRLRVLEGEIRLEQGRPRDALKILKAVGPTTELPPSVLTALLRARIDAYRAMNDPDGARTELEALLEVAPRDAGAIIASLIDALRPRVEVLLDVDELEMARNSAELNLVPLAQLAERWLAAPSPPDAVPEDTARVRRILQANAADGYRLAGRFDEALRLYVALVADHPRAQELIFGRAECLFGLADGREDEAMILYRRLAGALPDTRTLMYWQSQLRMLQILDRVDRNTERIAPRIRRLRAQDPELGGQRFRREFQALERRHG